METKVILKFILAKIHPEFDHFGSQNSSALMGILRILGNDIHMSERYKIGWMLPQTLRKRCFGTGNVQSIKNAWHVIPSIVSQKARIVSHAFTESSRQKRIMSKSCTFVGKKHSLKGIWHSENTADKIQRKWICFSFRN